MATLVKHGLGWTCGSFGERVSVMISYFLCDTDLSATAPSACIVPPVVVSRWRRCAAFTLVELLVVIVIIGILIALLLPAIQAAREAARRMQCANSLKQMSLAALTHENTMKHFPSGGWGFLWVGDPDRGFGRGQPGGFFYNILPFMEWKGVHDMPKVADTNAKMHLSAVMIATPIEAFSCPTRRAPTLSPAVGWLDTLVNAEKSAKAGGVWYHADYKANGGSVMYEWNEGPHSWADALAGVGFRESSVTRNNGLCYQRSTIKLKEIVDGTSNTYLCGEKYLNPDAYRSGTEYSDDQPFLGADDYDLVGWTSEAPTRDRHGYSNFWAFGSNHAAVFNMAFCDGAVRPMRYDIDPATHVLLGSRNDHNQPAESFK